MTKMIMTELNQVLTLDIDKEHYHGVELRITGGPDEGCIYLTPILLYHLGRICYNTAFDLDKLRPHWTPLEKVIGGSDANRSI